MSWFKGPFTRHVCLVNHDSLIGINQNPWTFSLLKYWLKAVLVPLNREFSVVDNVIDFSNKKLSQYFKSPIELSLEDTSKALTKRILCKNKFKEQLSLPQISIDSSGFVMTRPDSFLPMIDIIKTKDEYIIQLDIPGMQKDDIILTRRNVVTQVKGVRKRSKFCEETNENLFQKNERKFGEFNLNFRVPDEYEKKWHHVGFSNGVMTLKYLRDPGEDDSKVDNLNACDNEDSY